MENFDNRILSKVSKDEEEEVLIAIIDVENSNVQLKIEEYTKLYHFTHG